MKSKPQQKTIKQNIRLYRHCRRLLLPYERHAMSLAAEESTVASTSVATPPKKRKISDVSDLPFEVNKINIFRHQPKQGKKNKKNRSIAFNGIKNVKREKVV